jgi:hypothetical protein
MSQRLLLVAGVSLIAAALALGTVGFAGRGGGPASFLPSGMMGGVPWTSSAGTGGRTISIDQAQQAVQTTLDQMGDRDLLIKEVMEFQDNFYAILKEKSTGTGAFELLVNRSTGAVAPEPGPNMMWNTRYGIMGGGMIGVGASAGPMTVTAEQARQAAQRWLDQNQSGSTTEAPDAFYGYYTMHSLKEGSVTGMLSVNGYTGQVWYHTWHGAFIQEKDLGR